MKSWSPTRREVLWAALAAPLVPKPSFGRQKPAPRMRHFVQLLLSGGVDAVLTTDPKSRAEVEPWVDVPYGASDIVTSGRHRLGPLFKDFAPLAPRLAILNNVHTASVVHPAGIDNYLCMRTRAPAGTPKLSEALAPLLAPEPLPLVTTPWLQPDFDPLYDPRSRGSFAEAAEALRAQAGRAPADKAQGYRRAAAFYERLQAAPPFEEVSWTEQPDLQPLARQLQRLLWLLRSDLVTCVELEVGAGEEPWDTHTFNLDRQKDAARIFSVVARFFHELTLQQGPHGRLSEVTTVVMASELGRFPRVNGLGGKDHFPEMPMVFFGAGIRAGEPAFGASARTMEGMPVSFRTGRRTKSGRLPRLDDVGATLLRLAGAERPELHGSRGQLLEFLVTL